MKKTVISTGMVLVLFLVLAIYQPSTLITKAQSRNIALHKPVVSSGSIHIATQQDFNVTDGDRDTKWCAGIVDFNHEMYVWEERGHFVIIDLQDTYYISKFAIFQASTGMEDRGILAFNMTQFKVEVSLDGEDWQVIADEGAVSQEEEVIIRTFPTVSARYFKLSSMRPDITTEHVIRIVEIEVFEDADAVVTTPEPIAPGNDGNVQSDSSDTVDQSGGGLSMFRIVIIIFAVSIVAGTVAVLGVLRRKRLEGDNGIQ